MKRTLYFDCFSGISGDMTVGALLDLGIDQAEFQKSLNSLGVKGYRLMISKKSAYGIAATDFDIIIDGDADEKTIPHRHLKDIEEIIKKSRIEKEAKRLSLQIFETIARAEAAIHNMSIDRVHFHEVGAIDSIVDIIGTAVCISMLKPDRIVASPLHIGSGTVTSAHGILPVPAPATTRILEGVPIYATELKGELVTPTGAAIIKNLAADFIPLPPMTIEKTGYGTGKKDFGQLNALRVISGTSTTDRERNREYPVLLESNIDDMNPENYSYLLPLILEKGALDVFLTDVIMKKGRPGIQISVLCRPEDAERFENLLFAETTTLGVRRQVVERTFLDRKLIDVKTALGTVTVKAALRDGKPFKIAPEYESCLKIARKKGMPLADVYRIVRASADDLLDE